jgi:hypothetical protein
MSEEQPSRIWRYRDARAGTAASGGALRERISWHRATDRRTGGTQNAVVQHIDVQAGAQAVVGVQTGTASESQQ